MIAVEVMNIDEDARNIHGRWDIAVIKSKSRASLARTPGIAIVDIQL